MKLVMNSLVVLGIGGGVIGIIMWIVTIATLLPPGAGIEEKIDYLISLVKASGLIVVNCFLILVGLTEARWEILKPPKPLPPPDPDQIPGY